MMKQRPSSDPSDNASGTEAESDTDFEAYHRARTISVSSLASSMSMAPTPGASSGPSLTRTYSHTSMNSDVTYQESQRDDGYQPFGLGVKTSIATLRVLEEPLRQAL